jgi:hypothetical protein
MQAVSQGLSAKIAERRRLQGVSDPTAEILRLAPKAAREIVDLENYETKYSAAFEQSGSEPPKPPTNLASCPCCDANLSVKQESNKFSLERYAAPKTLPFDQGMHEEATKLRAAADLTRRALANTNELLAKAKSDLATYKASQESLKDIPPESVLVKDQELHLDKAAESSQLQRQAQTALNANTQLLARLEQAGIRQNEAATAHDEVNAWSSLEEMLSPTGIPARLSKQKIAVINTRLIESHEATGYPLVTLDIDMSITIGGRPYSLCGESSKWVADTMISEAIQYASKVGLMIIDRLDVLAPAHRMTILAWLTNLATTGDLQNCFVMCTLKQPITSFGDMHGISSYWLENGEATRTAEALAPEMEPA